MGKIYRNGKTITPTNYIERNINEAKKYMAEIQVPDEFASKTSRLKSFMSSDKKLWLLGCSGQNNIYKYNNENDSFELFYTIASGQSFRQVIEFTSNIICIECSRSIVKYNRETNSFIVINANLGGSYISVVPFITNYGIFYRSNNDDLVCFNILTETAIETGYRNRPQGFKVINDNLDGDVILPYAYGIIRFDVNTQQWITDKSDTSTSSINNWTIAPVNYYDNLGHLLSEITLNNHYVLFLQPTSPNSFWLYSYGENISITKLEDFPGGKIYKTNDPSKYIICESNNQPKIYLWDTEVNSINQIGQYTTEQTGTVYPNGFEYNGKYIIYGPGVSNMAIIDKETFVQIDIPNPSTKAIQLGPVPLVAHNGDLLFIYSTTLMFRLNFTTNTLEFIYGSETTTSGGYSGLYLRFVYNNKTYIAPDAVVEYSNQASGLYEYDGNAITQITSGGGHDLAVYENRAFAISKFVHAGLVTIGGYTVCLDDTTKKWTKTLINCNNKYYLASVRQYDICEELNLEDLTTQVSNDTGITACLLSKQPTICLNTFNTSSTSSGGKVVFSNQNAQAVSTRIYKSLEYLFTQKIPVFVNNTSFGAFYLWFKGEFV